LRGITGSGLRDASGSETSGITGSGLRGITGSGLRGITGSGLRGITGSGLRETGSSESSGITGSGLRGITGSGLRGITGSGLRGITGSGLRGITGSGLRDTSGSEANGITGSGLRGITGSGLRGITGSGLRGITGSGLRGITGSGLRGITGSGLRSAALGPVESLNAQSGVAVISVAGQIFIASSDDVSNLQVGDYVLAAGSGEGELSLLVGVDEPYVPGSSTIWVRGEVTSVSTELGRIGVGFASFDYTPVLATLPDLEPQLGSVIEVGGIQPVPGGTVLVEPATTDATALRSAAASDLRLVEPDSATQGITGSGLR